MKIYFPFKKGGGSELCEIIAFSIIQVTEALNSIRMEKLGVSENVE